MRTQTKTALGIFVAALLIHALCGCHARRDVHPPASELTEAKPASATAVLYSDFLKSLHPVRVYSDHINTVVVQRVTDGVESGKYLIPLISSYIPFGEEAGFRITPTDSYVDMGRGTGLAQVYDYRRSQPDGAADGGQPFRSETNQASGAAGPHR
jgi:hypothetical protein